MGVRLIPPIRRQPIVLESREPTLRLSTYLESISNAIADLPDIIPDIADITGSSSVTENRDKINEILIAMRTAGLMV